MQKIKSSIRLTWIFALIIGTLHQGCKEENKTERLKQQVIENETAFNDLVTYFTSVLPDSTYIVTFGVENKNTVHLV